MRGSSGHSKEKGMEIFEGMGGLKTVDLEEGNEAENLQRTTDEQTIEGPLPASEVLGSLEIKC